MFLSSVCLVCKDKASEEMNWSVWNVMLLPFHGVYWLVLENIRDWLPFFMLIPFIRFNIISCCISNIFFAKAFQLMPLKNYTMAFNLALYYESDVKEIHIISSLIKKMCCAFRLIQRHIGSHFLNIYWTLQNFYIL